jgi:hypothetical protein
MSDLLARLQEAAAAAIANERPSFEHEPRSIRGVTIELTVGAAGELGQCIVYVERRTSAGALLARQVKGSAA